MAILRWLRWTGWSPPELGVFLGLIVGVIDSIYQTSSAHFRVAPFEPIVIIWTWITVCGATGLIFSSPFLGRFRVIPLAFAGPGLLLLSREATPFKEATGLSTSRVLAVWSVAILALGGLLALIPLEPTRRYRAYIAATLVSAAILGYTAMDVRLSDWWSSEARADSRTERNVVLIFLDTVRAGDALGSHPAMPHLASFAGRATAFDNAWAPAPWTVPSHFAIFSGKNWWRLTVDPTTGFQSSDPNLAEQFRAHGYETAAILANPLLSREAGFARGFDEFMTSQETGVCRSGIGDLLYRVLPNDGPRMPVCSWFKASEISERALQFVRRAKKPYFLALNYLDAHEPYYVPWECRAPSFQIVPRQQRQAVLLSDPSGSRPDPAIVNRMHAQYRAAINCMDRSLGKLLEELERDPNTVIAIVGDHGEEFLEHGRGGHGLHVYRESLHVPLIIKGANLPVVHVTDPVSTTDLFLSLLRAAKVVRGDAPMPLLDPLQRRKVISAYEWVRAENEPPARGFSIVSGGYQFISWPGGRELLYAYQADPAEAAPIPPAERPEIADPMRQVAIRAARDKQRTLAFNAIGYLR